MVSNQMIQSQNYHIEIEGDTSPFRLTVHTDDDEDGISRIHLRLEADAPTRPKPLTLRWEHPMVETHLVWSTGAHFQRTLPADWANAHVVSRSTSQSPVLALCRADGRNALTFAFSDALNAVQIGGGLVEEKAVAACSLTLFAEPVAPLQYYEATLRLDTRPLSIAQTLHDVANWWATMPEYLPATPPEHTRLPIYSTWYTFHQNLDAAAVEEQCRLAKALGMETIIVDDGWQTDDSNRGYKYCGDWMVTPRKFPDFAAHVAKVHEIGLKYMLWFAVPFVGVHTAAYQRFQGKFLNPKADHGWHVLDPRFPEVRTYLIDLYCSFVINYDIDGFKLDFVDAFRIFGETQDAFGNGRDYESVPAAANRLLTDVIESLRAVKPEILIEFRQTYIGPLMRKYGNMLRAGDVPNDFVSNRVRVIDVRLLAGETPAHADMVMWHPDEPVTSAAMQIIHTLFSVPQISVRLDEIPANHVAMIRFYLAFWRQHRDVLLDGTFMPQGFGANYTAVYAQTATKLVTVAYETTSLTIGAEIPDDLLIVNGTFMDQIILKLAHDGGPRHLTITSCTGETVRTAIVPLTAGLHSLDLPAAGVAHFVQASAIR